MCQVLFGVPVRTHEQPHVGVVIRDVQKTKRYVHTCLLLFKKKKKKEKLDTFIISSEN